MARPLLLSRVMNAPRFSRLVLVPVLLAAGLALAGLQGTEATTPGEAEEAAPEAPAAVEVTVEDEGYYLSEKTDEGYVWSQGHEAAPES